MMAMALQMCSGATPGPVTLGLSAGHQDLETPGALAPSDFVEAHEPGDRWLRAGCRLWCLFRHLQSNGQVVNRAVGASLDCPRREDPGFVQIHRH